MARTYSQPIEPGAPAPPFHLPAANPEVDAKVDGHRSLDDYAGAEALVVIFTCNHCPYARHVEDALIRTARDYRERGVAFVAICSNDPAQAPDDAFERLAERARKKAYPFPYLYDASQEVARAYGAVCTPDLYVYDRQRRLAYHGRLDETRPGQGEATAGDLRRALDDLLATGVVSFPQLPSMGCNIKWKPGS